MADEFKWVGFDPITTLLGGESGRLKQLKEHVDRLAEFTKVVKEINDATLEVIPTVEPFIAAIMGETPVVSTAKAAFDLLKPEIISSLEDLAGTGTFFVDLNASDPPMWAFGESFRQQFIKSEIRTLEEESLGITDDAELLIKENEIAVAKEGLSNASYSMGGPGRYYKVFCDSLEDPNDFNRPMFSDRAPIAALFIMFGSSNINELIDLLKQFFDLFGISSTTPGPLPAIRNLKVNYIHPVEQDGEYGQVSAMLAQGKQNYLAGGGGGNLQGTFVIQNLETGKIVSNEGVSLTAHEIATLKNGAGFISLAAKQNLDESTNYWGVHKGTFFLDKEVWDNTVGTKVEKVGCDDGTLHTSSGWIDKGVRVFEDSETPREGTIVLKWDYPQRTRFLSNIFSGTEVDYTDVYIYKQIVKIDDQTSDLRATILNGVPPEPDNKTVFVYRMNSLSGLKSFYWDFDVEDSRTLEKEGVIRIEYAVATGYVIGQKVFYPGGIASYPAIISEIDPEHLRIMGDDEGADIVKDRLYAMAKSRVETYELVSQDTKNELTKKFGSQTLTPIDSDFARDLDVSNIGVADVAGKYTSSLGIPPDWHSAKLFGDLLPGFSDLIKMVEAFLEPSILKNLKDTFVEDLKEILLELSKKLNLVLKMSALVSKIIKILLNFNVGIYVMGMASEKGGINFVKQMLSLSLQGERTDIDTVLEKVRGPAFEDVFGDKLGVTVDEAMVSVSVLGDASNEYPDSLEEAQAIRAAMAIVVSATPEEIKLTMQGGVTAFSSAAAVLDAYSTGEILNSLNKFDDGSTDSQGIIDALVTVKKVNSVGETYGINEDALITLPWQENVRPLFQSGPPPFEAQDYVGGYAFVAGTGSLADLLGVESYDKLQNLQPPDLSGGAAFDFLTDFGDLFIDQTSVMGNDKDTTETPEEEEEPPDSTDEDQKGVDDLKALVEAGDAANDDDLTAFAKWLALGMGNIDEYAAAGLALQAFSYDNAGFLKLIEALNQSDIAKMKTAALLLDATGFVFPGIDDVDDLALKNAIISFRLAAGLAIALDLASINLTQGMNGLRPTIDLDSLLAKKEEDFETDTYQVGYNVALHMYFDPRTLQIRSYLDELEVTNNFDTYEVHIENIVEDLEVLSYNDSWEVLQLNEFSGAM